MGIKLWIINRYFGLRLNLFKFFGKKYKFNVCGHSAKLWEEVEIFGQRYISVLGREELTHCHKCLAKMTIRCAWCGDPIKIGDPVTLYIANRNGFIIPSYATVYQQKPLQLVVGCLKKGCSDSGADRTGFWVIPGKVQRVISPFEEVLASGKQVFCGDITDPNQAIKMP